MKIPGLICKTTKEMIYTNGTDHDDDVETGWQEFYSTIKDTLNKAVRLITMAKDVKKSKTFSGFITKYDNLASKNSKNVYSIGRIDTVNV